MRLIDESELKKSIEKWLNPDPNADRMVDIEDIVVSVMMEIEEQPTAYDVDKVVAELEAELCHTNNEMDRCVRENLLQFDSANGYANGITVAIQIVKGGSVDGD